MPNYEARLDRIEAAIAPKDELHVLFVRDGETNEQVLTRFAEERGTTMAEVRGTVVYFSEGDARLL